MTIEVRVPVLPESVADAQLVSWQKQIGDPVSRDENLVEIETDKVVLEVPAPGDGVLVQIVKEDGSMVTSDELIAVIDPEGKAEAPAAPQAAAETPAPAAAPVAAVPNDGKVAPLSPAVRRLVTQHNLDPAQIPASGRDGRLTKGDVLAFVEKGGAETAPPPAAAAAAPSAPAAAPAAPGMMPPPPPLPSVSFDRGDRREKMSRLRSRIAERLLEAQQTAAILTTFNEVDLTEVMAIRSRLKDDFEKRHGARLGFMSFFVKAACEALEKFPIINASVDGDEIVYHDYFDIGIAVSSPRGLVVPVLRDADQLNFSQVESTIADFGKRAREGSLGIDELSGGTFSITNGGVFGSLLSTPILNPPQSAILGMHKIQQRPMAVNGEVKIRPVMYLALSYDHRIIDGRDAVQFLVAIKDALEDPAKLMLSI